ncbi:MAG: hypothetical protein RL062_238, partial [Bacteroidota bacterium]
LTECSTWDFANKIGNYFDRLKRGMEPDPHNWNFRVV